MISMAQETQREVEIPVNGRRLSGILTVPAAAKAVVVFAHGSGSGRFSPRNQYVARVLQQAGCATLLVDLLGVDEADVRANVFDIHLLADRLARAAVWLGGEPTTSGLPLGYFGASTGAGAALVAAVQQGDSVKAVVSRGGRPDLAANYLSQVKCPTLLIVGGNDPVVLELNRQALQLLRCTKELVVVPGAGHLFEEPGALEQVAQLATTWFMRHLAAGKEEPSQGGTSFGLSDE